MTTAAKLESACRDSKSPRASKYNLHVSAGSTVIRCMYDGSALKHDKSSNGELLCGRQAVQTHGMTG